MSLARRIAAASPHAAGIHTDCDRSRCEWWASLPAWQRRSFEASGGRRWIAVKELAK